MLILGSCLSPRESDHSMNIEIIKNKDLIEIQARNTLIDICEELGILDWEWPERGYLQQRSPKARETDLDPIAEKLSTIAGKSPPWSGNYLYNVIRGNYGATKRLANAISEYARVIDGLPMILAGLEPVLVYAKPGSLKKYTVIDGDSCQCANPDCGVWFIKKVWNQIYCSWLCNRSDRARRRKERGWN